MPKLSEMLGEAFDSLPDEVKTKYKEIDLVDSKSYVKKTKYDAEIKKRDDDLEGLKTKSKGNKDLEDEIERLKLENETSAKEHQKELDAIKFNAKFEEAVAKHKGINPKAIRPLLNMDGVKLIDDNIIGLDEQFKALKESDSYLFEAENPGGTGELGGGSGFGDNKEKISIGSILAKSKTDNSSVEAQNKFFQ